MTLLAVYYLLSSAVHKVRECCRLPAPFCYRQFYTITTLFHQAVNWCLPKKYNFGLHSAPTQSGSLMNSILFWYSNSVKMNLKEEVRKAALLLCFKFSPKLLTRDPKYCFDCFKV